MAVVIVQARMGSRRFPGKVLCSVNGRPLLEYIVERISHCDRLETIIIATSTDDQDDPIANFCATRNIECFRGSLSNVADRFLKVAHKYNLERFVRISGDSILLDTKIICACLSRFDETKCDLVTNTYPRTFPHGQSVEVIRTSSFCRAFRLMTEPDDFEHVTRLFYRLPEKFRIENVKCTSKYKSMHLAVDTREDMQLCEAIIGSMKEPHWQYGLDDIAQLYASVTLNISTG